MNEKKNIFKCFKDMFISLYRNWNNIATINSNIIKYNVKVNKNYLKQLFNLKLSIEKL